MRTLNVVLLTKIKVVVLLSLFCEGIAKDFVAETREPDLFSKDVPWSILNHVIFRHLGEGDERHVPENRHSLCMM